jgi:hypothetical protein
VIVGVCRNLECLRRRPGHSSQPVSGQSGLID